MTADPKRMAYAPAEWDSGVGEFTDANGTLWRVHDMAYAKSRTEYRQLLRRPGAEWFSEFECGRGLVGLAIGDPLAQRREFSPLSGWARGRTYRFVPGDDHGVEPVVLAEQLRQSYACGPFPVGEESLS